jgi:hypothetical protein
LARAVPGTARRARSANFSGAIGRNRYHHFEDFIVADAGQIDPSILTACEDRVRITPGQSTETWTSPPIWRPQTQNAISV